MIQINIEKCTGCRRCETACSFFHSGRISPQMSRIKVLNLYETGVDGPVLCRQCQERYCMKCPVDAMRLGENGQVVVSPTVCSLCGACQKNCPIGAIEQFDGFVYVCDLCGGSPKCIEACTEGALVWSDEDDHEKPSFKAHKQEAKGLSPIEKRWRYMNILAASLRKMWRTRHA